MPAFGWHMAGLKMFLIMHIKNYVFNSFMTNLATPFLVPLITLAPS